MLVRIVKLSFSPENIDAFLKIFENTKEQIRNFKGCMHLELYRDKDNTSQFFTYSYWENENALEKTLDKRSPHFMTNLKPVNFHLDFGKLTCIRMRRR